MSPRGGGAPIGFAHRGARAHARENTLEAFRLAIDMGATGLESDVWLTADSVAVLDHDGVVETPTGKVGIREFARADLPAWIPSLDEFYAECGAERPLSLDVKDATAAPEVIEVARRHRAVEHLWLCHPDWRVVAGWRAESRDVRLVDSTRIRRIDEGVTERARSLVAAEIDAVNLHHTDWKPAHVEAFQSAGLRAFSWDLQTDEKLRAALDLGVDAVYSDHVDRMMAALRC
ncbi:MAG: glycerophosphodiester phosphodiesterase [Deltaproteobacteria bacterium]|nr:glycerophosphodiester phosphodiesterase [Deltaproteobacteria bacterium]MBW2415325.1 glycerophosphodiester phosphodiesterase [Deltaproteobacteria bacterium]